MLSAFVTITEDETLWVRHITQYAGVATLDDGKYGIYLIMEEMYWESIMEEYLGKYNLNNYRSTKFKRRSSSCSSGGAYIKNG